MTEHAIRAVDHNGAEYWYTGRAGKEFVSSNRADAFTAYTLDGARRKATILNRMQGIHGLRFMVPCSDE